MIVALPHDGNCDDAGAYFFAKVIPIVSFADML